MIQRVFSSSTGTELSQERADWGNGAFTLALKEGLAGAADRDHTGRVTTDMLDAYLRIRVAEMTSRKQHPVSGRSESAQGFPLSVP